MEAIYDRYHSEPKFDLYWQIIKVLIITKQIWQKENVSR